MFFISAKGSTPYTDTEYLTEVVTMFKVTYFNVAKLNKAKTVKEQWQIILKSKANARWKTRGQELDYMTLWKRMEDLEQVEAQLQSIVNAYQGYTMPAIIKSKVQRLKDNIKFRNSLRVVFDEV